MEISSHTLILLFTPGLVHRGSASWDDCNRVFQVQPTDELRVSSFPDRFPHCAWTAAQSAHSDFVGSKAYACLGLICHLRFWQNVRGLLRANSVFDLTFLLAPRLGNADAEIQRISSWQNFPLSSRGRLEYKCSCFAYSQALCHTHTIPHLSPSFKDNLPLVSVSESFWRVRWQIIGTGSQSFH